jgi:predicted HTH transcriptional regulator
MPYNQSKIGYKQNRSSKQAADFNQEGKLTIRYQVLELFKEHGELTNEQVSQLLNKPEISVQPRISELKNAGVISDSGKKAMGKWGTSITIWSYDEKTKNIG